jgi:hypothetical protein
LREPKTNLGGTLFTPKKTDNTVPDRGPGLITFLYAEVNSLFCTLAVCLSEILELTPVYQLTAEVDPIS